MLSMEGGDGADQGGFALRPARGEEADERSSRPPAGPTIDLQGAETGAPSERVKRTLQKANRECGAFHVYNITK